MCYYPFVYNLTWYIYIYILCVVVTYRKKTNKQTKNGKGKKITKLINKHHQKKKKEKNKNTNKRMKEQI